MRPGLGIVTSLLALLALRAWGKSDKPGVEETKFASAPINLFYFEDSDVVLVTESKTRTAYRSSDAGVRWEKLDGVTEGAVLRVLKHPFDNQVAVVLGSEQKHWITKDQGKSWKEWSCPVGPTPLRPPISFHATNPERMLFMTAECSNFDCKERVYYTTDGFDTDPEPLHKDAVSCLWAKSTDLFTTGSDKLDENQVLCIVRGSFNPFSASYRLLSSNDFFKTETEPAMNKGRTVSGIMNLAAVKSYIVAAAKSEGTTELAMYVTDDANKWHRAEFGEHKLEEDAYTLLESTNYSMQVDVLTTKPTQPMGVFLTSNSNGTFFTKNIEHTNRNTRGFVDFEKIQNIQGIVMVNTVDNWEQVEQNWSAGKQLKTKISFDDGRKWQSLRTKDGDDELHLHSVTGQRNLGRIFSSPAPGIVMGVGNTGKSLRRWDESDTFVSDDAGLTWRRALSRPHFYEFGDQGAILVAVEDGAAKEIKWSLNHGKDWESMELEDTIKPLALTTVPDSTSRKFILTATKGRGQDLDYFIYSFDFGELDVKDCKDSDFEKWWARVDEDGEPTCLMGHTQSFKRRKADSKCFVDQDFKDPIPETEDCKCMDEDYECDYENGFTHSEEGCKLTGTIRLPDGACEDGKETFMGSSGYRLIPGNTCTKKGGSKKDEPVERKCMETEKPDSDGKIKAEITAFEGSDFIEYYYLERSETSHGNDETVIMRTDRREAWLSHDHGKTWMQIVEDDEVVAIYPHQYMNDVVYIITPSKKVYYSKDRGKDIHHFDAPTAPNQDHIQILTFHPTEKDWLIWTGGSDCTEGSCQTIAHVSRKGGFDWETLLPGVRKCQFLYREKRKDSDQLVYCEQYEDEDPTNPLVLLSSDDWFDHKKELKRDVINFATMAEYIVVALRDPDQESLQVDTSIDGQVFADAKFPSNFHVPHQQAYTVLDSSTHAVFLHVTVNNKEGQEYGSIVKSNSNGTSYVLSVGEVNRNSAGYVDFEKMQGLEGVAVINRVANVKETDGGSAKKIKTYITHNDGADWSLIPRPVDPPKGISFNCKGTNEKCSLHLHGYTERRDPRDTYSSPSAVGLMIGTGNVGEFLGFKKDADTFITRDGGVSWHQVAPGVWMWEYGDQGSIIVIVKENEPTKEVMYSLNEGVDWYPFEFSTREMLVDDITTLPSDTSRSFLLWGRIKDQIVTVSLDFTGLVQRSRKCVLDETNPGGKDNDYDLWSPPHPNRDDKCLFGHVAEYHRKKIDRDCYNGESLSVQHLHAIAKNCSCTREDFECDYNYERQSDNSCKLVDGLQPPDPMAVCEDKNVIEYYEVTGYRRIPITTCDHSTGLDLTAKPLPCPGREPEFKKKYGMSGVALFFVIVLPIAAAAGVGYYVWKHWDGQFGRIRLGGDGRGSISMGVGSGAFDREAPWIKYPVLALSGVVAVIAAIPMVVSSLWKAAATRLGRSRSAYAAPYTSRSSFSRGRGDYAVVDPDEGELLGDDSDDEA